MAATVAADLEAHKNLISHWWNSSKKSETEITEELQRANIKTTEWEIYNALELWGFITMPSPDVSSLEGAFEKEDRHVSSFIGEGLPAFLEIFGSPASENYGTENPPTNSKPLTTSDDLKWWYAGTEQPVFSWEDDTSTSREHRIGFIMERATKVLLPELNELGSQPVDDQEDTRKLWLIERDKHRAKSESRSRMARRLATRRRDRRGGKKGSVSSSRIDAPEKGDLEMRRDSVASQSSGYSSSKRLRSFSISDDEERDKQNSC